MQQNGVNPECEERNKITVKKVYPKKKNESMLVAGHLNSTATLDGSSSLQRLPQNYQLTRFIRDEWITQFSDPFFRVDTSIQ